MNRLIAMPTISAQLYGPDVHRNLGYDCDSRFDKITSAGFGPHVGNNTSCPASASIY